MKKADNFNVHEWNHKQKLANIITESQLNEDNSTFKSFIEQNYKEDFFAPFIKTVTDVIKTKLDPNKQEDWVKITKMDEKQLENNYGLTPDHAVKLKKMFGNESKTDNGLNTVPGKIKALNDFFKRPGTSGDYKNMKDIYNHFVNEKGTIEDLKPELKQIYMKSYKPFKKEEFIKIFNGIKI